eukprot:59996-Hanusia_phi.AAC.1
MADLGVVRILGWSVTLPVQAMLNMGGQLAALFPFLLLDADAALGRQERIFAPGTRACADRAAGRRRAACARLQ